MEKGVYELFTKWIGFIKIKNGPVWYTKHCKSKETALEAVEQLLASKIAEYENA